MADRKVTLKRVIDSLGNTNIIYPKTVWDQVDEKPSTFTPTSHTHTESEILDLGNYEPADATILKEADIGVTLQPFNANTVIDPNYATFNPDGTYLNLRAQATTKTDVGLNNVENYSAASQAEAEAGTANDKYMTPLRVNQAIQELAPDPDLTTYDNHIADGSIHFSQGDIQITESQISDFGNYEPADATILKSGDIGVTVQGFDANTVIDANYQTFNPSGTYLNLRAQATTKADVGLGDVDNVQQASKANFDAHTGDGTIHFTQGQISITESQISDLGTYEPLFTKNTAFNKDFGNTAGTVAEGNDARLSDARTPTAHTHNASDIDAGRLSVDRLPTSTTANKILKVGTANSSPGYTTLVEADIPNLNASKITEGTLPVARGGTGATTAASARTSLGATTIGGSLFTLTNPSAVSFPRFNENNTVSPLSAADFRTAIGAGTSSTTGTVTSVGITAGSGIAVAGGPITSSGSITVTNSAPHVATNLGTAVVSTNSLSITSSTGSNITVPVATTTVAGFMSHTDKTKLDGIESGAQVNVGTDIAQGTRTTTTVPVTSSTGTNATLQAATTSLAGVMTSADKTKLDGIESGAEVNVATNLGITAGTAAGPIVTSSTGTNATLPTATASNSGVVTTGNQTFSGTKTFNNTITGSVSGSAASLTTARKINGTDFNGTADITTANWGTARDIAVGSTTKSVNGSDNVAWTLGEIGAAAEDHTHDASDIDAGRLSVDRLPTSATANRILKVGTANTSPTYTTLVEADIPNLNASKITAGTLPPARGGTGRTDGRSTGVIETRANVSTQIWTGTEAQYNSDTNDGANADPNTLYFIEE